MDIGRPNNFPRIVDLLNNDYNAVKDYCWGASYSDEETERHIRRIYNSTGYIMCPHTAVGHLAMNDFAEEYDLPCTKITVATAHPAKFADSVERIIGEDIALPSPLAKSMKKKKRVTSLAPSLDALRDYLAQ